MIVVDVLDALQESAVHEAGHVVVAAHYELPVVLAEIGPVAAVQGEALCRTSPDPARAVLGAVQVAGLGQGSPHDARVLLAGDAAVRTWRRMPWTLGESFGRWLDRPMLEASRAVLSGPAPADAITDAQHLEALGPRDTAADAFLAAFVVRLRWSAVRRIAGALMWERRLDQQRIHELMEESQGAN